MCKKLVALVLVLSLASIASADLLAQYSFEDGTANNHEGTVGAAANGTLMGGATIVPDAGVPTYPWNPVKGPSLVLDVGTTTTQAYVNCGGGGGGWGDIPQATATIAAWIKWYDTGDTWSNFSTVTSKGGGENDGYSFSRFERNDDVTYVYSSTPGWSGTPSTKVGVMDGDWHHVVGTWKDGSVTGGMSEVDVYVDGVLTNSGARWRPAGLALNAWDVIIGGNAIDIDGGSGYRFWGGLIDCVSIYDEALDAAAVEALFNAPCIPEPTTIALLGLGGLALIRKRR